MYCKEPKSAVKCRSPGLRQEARYKCSAKHPPYHHEEYDRIADAMELEEQPIRIPITDVFDLHTVQPKEVEAVAEAYLEEADRLGLKTVRIIHGRGMGVQRAIVRAVLARTPFVLCYRDAPPESGGWGATLVNLR